MSLLESLYSGAVAALRPVLPTLVSPSPKVAAAVRGRVAAASRIGDWASARRDPERPLLWLHGSSAGELAGAAPVVTEVRRVRPDLQLLVTYSSPSAESVLPDLLPDDAGYPPLDTRADCLRALRAARPDALVFAKLDAWPALTRAAADESVPLGMVNATVRPRSTRLRGPGRRLLAPSYRRLSAVGAVSAEVAERLVRLGATREAIRITGDASFDRSLERVERARESAGGSGRLLPPRHPGCVRLIAGSTWPEDERLLIEGLARLRAAAGAADAGVELVLVPHEPDAGAVNRIRAMCVASLGEEPMLWSRPGDRSPAPGDGSHVAPAPLVVDAVGFLAELYLESDLAWVGGGVGGEGLHSVVEPAAAGLPTLFGPAHDRWEALGLIDCGAAREVVPSRFESVLQSLLSDAAGRRRMGDRGRDYVQSGRGAATAGAKLVLDLIDRARASAPARTRTGSRSPDTPR